LELSTNRPDKKSTATEQQTIKKRVWRYYLHINYKFHRNGRWIRDIKYRYVDRAFTVQWPGAVVMSLKYLTYYTAHNVISLTAEQCMLIY